MDSVFDRQKLLQIKYPHPIYHKHSNLTYINRIVLERVKWMWLKSWDSYCLCHIYNIISIGYCIVVYAMTI